MTNNGYIYFPELFMKFGSLKKYLLKTYNLEMKHKMQTGGTADSSMSNDPIIGGTMASSMRKGGYIPKIGDTINITDINSLMKGKSGVVVMKLSEKQYIVKTLENGVGKNVIVNTSGMNNIPNIDKLEKGAMLEYEDGYPTNNSSSEDLESLLNMLEEKNVPYDTDSEVIYFDINKLNEEEKNHVHRLLNLKFKTGGEVKNENKTYWRDKIEIAKMHMKEAINTKNAGWVVMLKKRIKKYEGEIEKFKTGGGVGKKRTMELHDAVIYKDETYYITEKDGQLGLKTFRQGAWGFDFNFVPLSKIDVDKQVKDMYGNSVIIPTKMATGGGVGDDLVYFIVDNDDADMLLHENFRKHIDYENLDNGDVLYKMDRRNFERFEDLAYSTSQKFEDAIEEVNSDGSYMMAKGGGVGGNKKIELLNGFDIEGPSKNYIKAKQIVKAIDKEMKSVMKEYEDEGESAAMDARDDVFYEYEEQLKEIGFKQIDENDSKKSTAFTEKQINEEVKDNIAWDKIYNKISDYDPIKDKYSVFIKQTNKTYTHSDKQTLIDIVLKDLKKHNVSKFAKGGGVDILPPQGTLLTKDKKLKLDYTKVGDNYEFTVYEGESNPVENYSRTSFKNKDKNVKKMNHNQFINYIYSEGYIDDNKMATGGGVGDFEGSGLIVVGRAQIDNNKIKHFVEDGDYYGVWNAREGYWFFQEDEDNIDELEMELTEEFDDLNIDARFEYQEYKNGGSMKKGGGVNVLETEEYHYKKYLDFKNKAEELLNSNEMPSKYETPKKGTKSYDIGKKQMEFSDEAQKHYSMYLKLKKEREQMATGGGVGDNKKGLLQKERIRLRKQLNDALENRPSTMSAIEESLKRIDYLIEYEQQTGEKISAKELKSLLNPYSKFNAKYKMETGGKVKKQPSQMTDKQKAGWSKMNKVMSEFKQKKLHSGTKKGPIVKDRQQAIAIALSEAREAMNVKQKGWKHKKK